MDMPKSPPASDEMANQMNFHWGKDVIILFQGWPSNNVAMYILALAFVFMLSAATEVLSVPQVVSRSSGSSSLLIQATAHAVKMGLAYLVMLSVMSYNLGIFIVAVAGHGLGFLLLKIRALAAAGAANQAASEFVVPKV